MATIPPMSASFAVFAMTFAAFGMGSPAKYYKGRFVFFVDVGVFICKEKLTD